MPIFSPGQTVITSDLHQMAMTHPELRFFIRTAMSRHVAGDWGDLSSHDRECNDLAVKLLDGRRIFSSYKLPETIQELIPELQDNKIWIITYPGDNTTILLPSQY